MEVFQYDPQHRRNVEGWSIICFDGEDKIGLTAWECEGDIALNGQPVFATKQTG